MSPLTVLRVAAAAAVIGLAVALIRLLLRRTSLGPPARAAWTIVAIIELVMIAGYLQAEAFASASRLWPGVPAFEAIWRLLYGPAYLLNAVLIAALPGLLIATLSPETRPRTVARVAVVFVLVGGAAVWIDGVYSDWSRLLGSTPLFTLFGIAGYVALWIMVALDRLPALDVYLAAFLVMRTLYEIAKPVQELFFVAGTQTEAIDLWPLHLFLQLLQRIGMIIAVGLLLRTLDAGRPPRSVSAPAAPILGR
jgi:hypothetical protein